jgi:hypothetical protein
MEELRKIAIQEDRSFSNLVRHILIQEVKRRKQNAP